MKNSALFSLLVLLSASCYAQVKDPVKWAFSSKKIDASTYEVRLIATLAQGWHLYSQTTPEGGPVPTTVSFGKNPLLVVEGKTKELGKLEQRHEELFGVDVKQFSGKVIFVQAVKLKGRVKTSLTGSVEYMTCNDHECLPPTTQKFSIALN